VSGRRSDAIRAALKGYVPTEEQWAAISHPLVPTYLVAGAGSGKTAVMAARIVWAIESQRYQPSQILGLTFTNKAAQELEDRVYSALAVLRGGGSSGSDDVTVQTYNAFAATIVRDHGLLVEVEPEAGLLSEAQQWQLVLSCLTDLPPFDAIELRSQGGIVRATLALAGSVSDHIANIKDVEAAADRILASGEFSEDILTAARRRKELCRVVEAYQAQKLIRERIDFGDQVTKAYAVLSGHPEIRDSYRERYPVVLLDEYQDTNVAQRKLIQELVTPGGAVTAVGDTRQAIYAFRGATMYNLIGFPDHFPRSGGEVYEQQSLSENFRSGRRILEVANAVVSGIDASRRPGAPLRPDEANGDGNVSLGLFSDEQQEAEWIAAECERLYGTSLAPNRPPVRWRDIAILVRRKATMGAILDALERAAVPVEVVGLAGLLKTPEVIDIVAWLRCLDTKPTANRWLARVLLGPRWRIHYRDLALCAHWAAGQNRDLRLKLAGGDEELARDLEPGDVGFSLLEAIGHVDEIDGLDETTRSRLTAFGERLAALQETGTSSLLELVQEVISTSGIGDALDASPVRTGAAARQNVANFLDHVAAFAPVEGEATLRSFLAYLDAAEDAEETLEATQPAGQDSVKLMTVHQAKGLEFECVFVPSVAASRNKRGEFVYSVFPNERSPNPLTSYQELPYEVREDRSHLPRFTGKASEFAAAVKNRVVEDERRLFYVALTRAKQYLAVTASWWYGRDQRERGPSLFWEELSRLESSGQVDVVRRADQPEKNPLFAALESRREWPPAPRTGADDELFPTGWGAAADSVIEQETTLEALLESLDPADRDRALALIDQHNDELDVIAAAVTPSGPVEAEVPRIVSATAALALEAGSKTAWDLVRPLPERPTAARRIGTEMHRIIEERVRGLSSWPEESELDEPAAQSDVSKFSQRLRRFEELGYHDRTPALLPSGEPMIELPFSMKFDERILRGRIDAVFTTDDGGLEIVDYKTGRRFEPTDPDQLDIYARALAANGLIPDGKTVTLTYVFLDEGEPRSRTWRP
jgi:DNA helicase II / ATP-dependent DNA helicase PcrA